MPKNNVTLKANYTPDGGSCIDNPQDRIPCNSDGLRGAELTASDTEFFIFIF